MGKYVGDKVVAGARVGNELGNELGDELEDELEDTPRTQTVLAKMVRTPTRREPGLEHIAIQFDQPGTQRSVDRI